jgi:hypothetical protein
MNNEDRAICPICKNKLNEHSGLQDKIYNKNIENALNIKNTKMKMRPLLP